MEGSGSTSNQVTCRKDGEELTVWVIASRDVVEIGGWEFKRSDLLLAMGATEDPKVIEGLREVIAVRNRQRAELERKLNELRSQVAQ